MNKLYIPAILALLVSCSQIEKDAPTQYKEEITPAGYKVLTLTAKKTEDTKTSYAGDKTFSWNVGDKISVICNDGDNNIWVTFTATTAAASSTFTSGEVAGNVVLGALDGTKVALYPASEHHVYGGSASGQISFHIPAERDFSTYKTGRHESAIPMFAWGTDEDTYAFSNLTGAAKFTFTNVPCSIVRMVYTVPSVKLNGTYSLLYDSINTADASNVYWEACDAGNASEKTVTYYGDVDDNNTVSFYLPYAQGIISGASTLQISDVADEEDPVVLYNNTNVGNISITKNQIAVLRSLSLSFQSAYGIDWSGIGDADDPSDPYFALKTLKATADATYIYLYIEANPDEMRKNHNYDCCFHFYKEDMSGEVEYWKDEYYDPTNASEIDAGHSKWAVNDGLIAFSVDGTDVYSSNLLMHSDTWYYEIRMKRSVDTAFASPGIIKIGVSLDDTFKQGSETGHSSSKPLNLYGVIPAFEEEQMYELTLP